MFGQAGRAYVYFVYGFHHMLNIVTEQMDFPAAVLIRAVEPIRGIALMKKRRGIPEPRQLANGPGKLCEAFAIDGTLNGSDLCGRVLYIRDDGDATTDNFCGMEISTATFTYSSPNFTAWVRLKGVLTVSSPDACLPSRDAVSCR